MRKIGLLVVFMLIFSAGLLVAEDIPHGEMVKIYIQNKTFLGELLSVTPELIVIRELEKGKAMDKYTVLGCPVLETKVVKVQKRCGPIGNIFTKGRKYTFMKNTPAKLNENLLNLSYYALYGSLIPDHVKAQMKLFGRN